MGRSDLGRCAHQNCSCRIPQPAEGPFCSRYCASAEVTEPLPGACSCGHAQCLDEQKVDEHSGAEVKTSIGE